MKRSLLTVLVLSLFAPVIALADTQDTAQFQVRMTTANEVPVSPVNATATATITIRVTRDSRGLINAATRLSARWDTVI